MIWLDWANMTVPPDEQLRRDKDTLTLQVKDLGSDNYNEKPNGT